MVGIVVYRYTHTYGNRHCPFMMEDPKYERQSISY
jgi:hypothetical protein